MAVKPHSLLSEVIGVSPYQEILTPGRFENLLLYGREVSRFNFKCINPPKQSDES